MRARTANLNLVSSAQSSAGWILEKAAGMKVKQTEPPSIPRTAELNKPLKRKLFNILHGIPLCLDSTSGQSSMAVVVEPLMERLCLDSTSGQSSIRFHLSALT